MSDLTGEADIVPTLVVMETGFIIVPRRPQIYITCVADSPVNSPGEVEDTHGSIDDGRT